MQAELRIREILESPSNLSDKIYIIVEEAKTKSDDYETLLPYIKFLFNSGHQQELIGLTASLLEGKKKISWAYLLECLSNSKVPLKKSALKSIEKGIRRQEALEEIWSVHSLDEHFPEFEELRKAMAIAKKDSFYKLKNQLLEKFEFLRNQGLDQEARQVLRSLRSGFPEDLDLLRLEAQFNEELARDVLMDFDNVHEETQTYMPVFSKEERTFLDQLREFATMDLKNHSNHYLELTYFFMFLEEYESALSMLPKNQNLSFSEFWLKAELLKQARRYMEALELADEILRHFSSEPESLLETLYFKAEIFSLMKKHAKALELLESITKVRPNYRSSSHLIQSLRSKGQSS